MHNRQFRLIIAAMGLLLVLASSTLTGWSMAPAEPGSGYALHESEGGGNYRISGRIRENTVGVPDITVDLYHESNPDTPIQSVTTDDDGFYEFTQLANGLYDVVPEDPAYDFDPTTQRVIIFEADKANVNFNAIFREYDVDGYIKEEGQGRADIIVRLYELPDTTTPILSNVTNAQGRYIFPDVVPGNYRVRPEHIDYTFEPPFRDLTVVNQAVTLADIEATLNTYNASGRVSDNGTNMGGVTLTLATIQQPDVILQTVTSSGSGEYIFTGVEPGSYRIVPELEDYLFVPDYRDVLVSGGDVHNINFEANINIFNISGTVEDNGNPLNGVQMVLTAAGNPTPVAYAATDSNGDYTFFGISPGAYRVTPARPGYEFLPPFRDVSISNADVNGVDFEADQLTYDASGGVEEDGVGLEGVTIELAWASNPNPIEKTVTDADGNFSFESLAQGDYRVTPILPLYSFDPPSRMFSLTTGDIPNLFFEARTFDLYLPLSIRQGENAPPPTPTPSPTAVACRMEIEPNSLADADANGNFEAGRCINGRIPVGDTNDFYRIEFPGGTFDASLTNLPAGTDFDLTLYRISNDTAELVGISNNSGTQNENILHPNLAAGVYYIGVQQFSGNSNELYRLIWAATP